ncbi:glycosyltransferase [Micromonospora sp. M12]
MLIRAIAALRERDPALADQVTVVICGGPSGSGLDRPTALIELAAKLGVSDGVRFLPPLTGDDLPALYRAADLVAVPSHNESFGLVALEAQACGTPVLAAAVGGLVTAVRDQVSGVLIDGHDPVDWARALGRLLPNRALRSVLARAPSSTHGTSPGTVRSTACSGFTARRSPRTAPGSRPTWWVTPRSPAPGDQGRWSPTGASAGSVVEWVR